MTRKRITARWVLIALGIFWQGQAMAFLKPFYLFSAIDGIVVLDGHPVKGAEVERQYTWKDDLNVEHVLTDAQGRYRFSEVTASSLLWSLLPHEPVIFQKLSIRYQGKEHKGWVLTKHNYDHLGEVRNRPLNLICDLNDEPAAHRETETFGICRLQ